MVCLTIIFEIISPTAALALTSGPSSPEFASFEPVATTDMVNDLTGDFTYNLPVISVPGPDGGGYSMSLAYHSGASPEEEASWVGFGWTLNPGAINRNKRGVADDFEGADVQQFNKVKPNWTQMSAFDANVEINSSDQAEKDGIDDLAKSKKSGKKAEDKFSLSLNGFGGSGTQSLDEENPWAFSMRPSFTNSIRYNNYSGFSVSKSFSVSSMGLASLSMNRSGGQSTLGFSVSPMELLNKYRQKITNKLKKDVEAASCDGEAAARKTLKRASYLNTALRNLTSMYSSWTYEAPAVPYSVAYNVGRSYNYSVSLQINPYGPVGFQAGIKGNINIQANYPQITQKAYGYLYNQNIGKYADNKDKTYDKRDPNAIILADYQLEKETTFNKHDVNLGIPYNTADNFSISGNGAMGGFQIHQSEIGHFFPNFLKNEQTIRQLGLEVGIGGTIEIGFDIGLGKQTTTVGDWDSFINGIDIGSILDPDDLIQKIIENKSNNYYNFSDEPFMRFTGDQAGEVLYSNELTNFDDKIYATVGGNLFDRKLDLSSFYGGKTRVDGGKNKTSSHIEYEKFNGTGSVLVASRLDNSIELNSYLTNRGSDYEGLIAQIGVTNKDGNKSIYGIPVFTQNELELSVGLTDWIDGTKNKGSLHDNVEELKYIKTRALRVDDILNNYTVSGQKIVKPWASTFLLTQNTTFDYVDADAINGPSEGDFGGWTKFAYQKVCGTSASDWYKYRAPYNGMYYNRGRLLDENDQTGSMASGEKEVFYLKAIETKTHIAFFVTDSTTPSNFSEYNLPSEINHFITGSGNDRKDAIGASKSITGGVEDASNSLNAVGSKRSQKLEKIVLFSKDDYKKPISVTNFEYSYELCQGTPNSELSSGVGGGGKLTLKKVWTEGGGTIKSRIAPYQFEYNYFRNYSSQIMTKYADLDDVYAGFIPTDENPNYKSGQLDAWGNYRPDGETRFKKMQPWVNQIASGFDPAAWQLKKIILPSGGEIHVQYEQKDYAYVQDQKAMVMTPLTKNIRSTVDQEKDYGYLSGDASTYVIDHDSIGLLQQDLTKYYFNLKNHFVANHEKLYFKFLYNLAGDEDPNLESFNRKVDYVSGYTTVNAVDTIELDPINKPGKYYIQLKLGELKNNGDGKLDKTLPRWLGYQMAVSNGGVSYAKQNSFGDDIIEDDIHLTEAAYNDGILDIDLDDGGLEKVSKKKALDNTFDFFGEWVFGLDGAKGFRGGKRKNFCHTQNYENSYFKLPVFKSKKGGGCRVKRILSYDKGIETGTEMVYGTEYIYKLEGQDVSSGVATNEPQSNREENALVGYLERKKQKGLDKILNGRDSKQFEGPLGEFLLPGASIVYSRVVMKNIHSGKTTTGYAVNEYHTCKDFPMQVDFSEISKDANTYRKLNLSLPLGLVNIDIQKAWVTQGYLFKLNDMHGKPKSQMTYSGNYVPDGNLAFTKMPTAKTVYRYSKPGESIETVLYEPSNHTFSNEKTRPGTEEDLTMYRSRVKDVTNNFSLEIDLNITLPVAVSLGFGISYQYQHSELSQHVTTKVMHLQSYLLSTTSTVDGVTQTTENLAFNRHTGDPILTRTYDGFMSEKEHVNLSQSTITESNVDHNGHHDGHYYALNIPASWIYDELGAKSGSNNYSNQLTASVGSIVTYGSNNLYSALSSGSYSGDFDNVISASAVVLKKDWFDSDGEYFEQIKNEFSIPMAPVNSVNILEKLNSHYYPERSFVYRDKVSNAHQVKIYNGGIINNSPVSMFDWNGYSVLPSSAEHATIGKWFSVSEALAYSPHGTPLAEKDILDIYSTAKFGADKTLPILVAQNANYDQVDFKDYELTGDNSIDAHSGAKSLYLNGNIGNPIISNFNFTGLTSRGVSMKLWLKSNLSENSSSQNYGKKNSDPQLKAVIDGNYYNFKKIAQTGEWTLYSMDLSYLNITGLQDIKLSYNFVGSEIVLIDDVRIQPLDAVMNCTVYSVNKKVTAQFDDQHFGVFYDYNQEGLLLRQSIETEKGRKTIKEQHQNSPLINRF